MSKAAILLCIDVLITQAEKAYIVGDYELANRLMIRIGSLQKSFEGK